MTASKNAVFIFAFLFANLSEGFAASIRSVESNQVTGSSLAVVVDRAPLAHTTQILPLNAKGEIVGNGDVAKQIEQIFKNLAQTLKLTKSDFNQIVKLNICVAQTNFVVDVQKALAKKFSGPTKPAVSLIVGKLAHPEALVGIDAVAVSKISSKEKSVTKNYSAKLAGEKNAAQVAILPEGGIVYVSGQAVKSELIEATRKTLEQLESTLTFLNLKKKDIVQFKAFILPMSEVRAVEKEFIRFFEGQTVPPIVFIEWMSKDVPIEIELIAASPEIKTDESIVYLTPPGMTVSGVYSKVARVQPKKLVYVSGLYGKTQENSNAQVEEIFATLKDVLKKSGSDMDHLVKATYFISSDAASKSLNDLRPRFYNPKRPPTASKALVKEIGQSGKSVTLDMIGVVAE